MIHLIAKPDLNRCEIIIVFFFFLCHTVNCSLILPEVLSMNLIIGVAPDSVEMFCNIRHMPYITCSKARES